MEFIRTEHYGDVVIATMSRGKANALNAQMAREFLAVFEEFSRNDASRSLVITSDRPGFFSTGLDAKEVFNYTREEMKPLWRDFGKLHHGIFTSPKPVVAALNGHTFAGGLVLALSCDVRIMDRGDHGLAVSGINIGVALPPNIMQMAIHACGVGHARHLFLTGETISPERAYEIGLVRELTDPGEARARAVEYAKMLAPKGGVAYGRVKEFFGNITGFEGARDEDETDKFLDYWYSDEATAKRRAVTTRLSSK